ncbi:MAG: response regulator transcription factor [Propionibacteriaceae bacterium]|jgi:two-component system response regulator MtrA|nr:response regulator transcription factor [Propionibacteriaceae bacterium]
MADGSLRVLVVDDDQHLAEMLEIVLAKEGYLASVCHHGDRALAAFHGFGPDLVLLDLMLPGRDGVEICRDIRAESDVPIVMLTAKSDTIDIVDGLEAGADDYVPKPFKTQELMARIKTRLRRHVQPESDQGTLQIGDLSISVHEHTVRRGNSEINLTPLEFDLLLALARRPRHAFTREVLLEEVWGYRHASDTRLVNVHVQRLRSKVENDPENPEIVVTVRGVGYRAGEPKSA